jgi:hypothetical protein
MKKKDEHYRKVHVNEKEPWAGTTKAFWEAFHDRKASLTKGSVATHA